MASEWAKLTQEQLAQIAPLKDGKPDLYNHLPTRNVPRTEAEARGWFYFYVGDVCSHGHKAPRSVKNPRLCIDCKRVKEGRPTIGGKGEAEYTTRLRPYSERVRQPTGTSVVQVAPRPLEPDALEKKFLVAYAKTRNFNLAAVEVNQHPAVFHGRLSYSKVFRDAVDFLETQYGLVRTPSLSEEFEWTDDKRATLLRVYVDTGELFTAMAAIGVGNYHFEREIRENSSFAAALAEVEPLANKFLGHVGVSQAVRGNDKLLQRLLSNVAAERFGESSRVKVDLSVTERLTDEQLRAEAVRLLLDGRDRSIIDTVCFPTESSGTIEVGRDTESEDSAGESEQNSDLI